MAILEKKTTTLTAVSWSMYFFWYQFMTGIFDVFLIYFYNVNLNLDIRWVTAAITVYTIWDGFNEPIVGYLTDKITKITRKWGKRFPWIMLGAFIAIVGFILSYLPPTYDGSEKPVILFLWMSFTTCLYDTGLTMTDISINALYPDKFRSQPERNKVQAWSAPISLMALPLSALVPGMLLLDQDDPSAYITFAVISGIILLGTFALGIYGVKEDPDTIDRYFNQDPEYKEKFGTAIKNSFKQRAWVMMLVMGYGYGLIINALQSSIPYAITYLIDSENDMIFMIVMAGLVMGGVIASPLWISFFKKLKDNKKSYLIAGTFLAAATFLNGFIVNDITAIIFVTIYGAAMGAFWLLNGLILADVYDERTVMYKTNDRGAAVGIMGFLGKFGRLLMIGLVAIIQITTGFDPEFDTQTPEAIFGIRLQMGFIPAVFYAILLIIWGLLYPINKLRAAKNRVELSEMNL